VAITSLVRLFKKVSYLTVTVGIAIFSFSLNVYTVCEDITAAFYSPLTRSWELLSGALLAHVGQRKSNLTFYSRHASVNGMSFVGAAMILAGLVLINEGRSFPGWWAVLPVVGTVLMILAGPKAWVNRVILSNQVFVWSDKLSFVSHPLANIVIPPNFGGARDYSTHARVRHSGLDWIGVADICIIGKTN
jgi:peptidoglycan/LPS O-acetylase OafA/YrhL